MGGGIIGSSEKNKPQKVPDASFSRVAQLFIFTPKGTASILAVTIFRLNTLKDSAFEQTLSRTLLFAQGTRTLHQQ